MCRNIKTLFNFDPPATEDEIRASSLQFVRKVSGFNKVSKENEQAFNQAVMDIEKVTQKMLNNFKTESNPKDREEEAKKAKARSEKRFGIK